MNSFQKGLFVGIVLLCLLFSNPAFAYSTQLYFEEEGIDSTNGDVNTNESEQTPVSSQGFTCDVSALTPMEAKSLMNLTHEGFQGEEIGDGKDVNADGINLEGLELVGKDNDGKTAVKESPPSQAASPDRFSFFDGRMISGPFGIGLLLDDTLRVGRCKDMSQEQCRVYGNGLNYRMSGTGVSNMFVSAAGTFADFTKEKALGLSEEEFTAMQNQVYDVNDLNVQIVQLSQGEQIANSFQTEQYTAKSATTCNNNACMISTYSVFDKYFNSWFSSEMVVSAFGPALFHSAAKQLGLITSGPKGDTGNKLLQSVNKWIKGKQNLVSETPLTLLGRKRFERYNALKDEFGLGTYFKDLTIGKKAFAAGAGGYVDEVLDVAKSPLNNLTPEGKKKFFQALDDLKAFAATSNEQVKAAKSVYQSSPHGVNDLIDYGRRVGNQYLSWDDVVFLDAPQWIHQNQELTGWAGLAVKKAGFVADEGFVDLTTGETFNFTKGLLKPFADTGDWTNSSMVRAATGNVQLYKLAPTELFETVPLSDLDSLLAKLGNRTLSVNVPGQGMLPLNATTVNALRNNPATGTTVDVFKTVYSPARELTPAEFANVITQDRITGRINIAEINLNNVQRGLATRVEFNERKSLSALDALFAKEQNLIKDYYTLKLNSAAFAKVALGPIGLWQMKRGFGNENFSAYMLPDSWTTMIVSQGQDNIYKDSYIDFFANEGSDQGDLFTKVINGFVFVHNYLVKEVADTLSPQIGEKLRQYSGEGGLGSTNIMRDEVMDIAFYSHNENCSGCTASINSKQDYLGFAIKAPVNISGFIVEAVDETTAKEEGTTLIAYVHHSNLKGATGEIQGQEINIASANDEKTSCDAKLRKLKLGWAGNVAGLLVSAPESLAYAINPGFGLIATGVQQILITPELQDCIDDKEGYYLHFYSPPSQEQAKAKSKQTMSNETVTSAIADLTEKVNEFTSQTDNPVAESIGSIKEEFDDFAGQAKQANILQATIEMLPPSSGNAMAKEIFYIWFKDNLMPIGLKTDGVSVTKDGNTEVIEDYANGDILINGKKVVSNKPEIVGLTTQDNRIPAKVIPKTVTTVSAPNNSEIVFEINTLGEVNIREAQVLDCIQKAIKAQSGIEYSGNELTQVFGNLQAINTQNYENIFVQDRKIQLEGSGNRVYGEFGARFIIDGYWQARLEQDANKQISAGQFIGMAFEHGSIVLNPETNELVVWLRQHKEAVLNSKEVSGMKARATTITDPETECEQPAIELEAEGYPNDQLGLARVENFNTSMKHLGPFTQFTTDGKIYEFYAKVDPKTGECKDYFRVIDKETGKILVDEEIVGGLKQLDDGTIQFKTADGKTHTLEFDADNGIPKVSYNGAAPETLRTAQGPNGSFWFDSNTGQWYPENGIQMPLNQAFKDQGAYFGTDENGNVTGTAGNPMTFNIGTQTGSGFNIPSLPETVAGLVIFIAAFLMLAFISTQKIQKKKK